MLWIIVERYLLFVKYFLDIYHKISLEIGEPRNVIVQRLDCLNMKFISALRVFLVARFYCGCNRRTRCLGTTKKQVSSKI